DCSIETGFPVCIRVTALGGVVPVEFSSIAHGISIDKILNGRISCPVMIPIGAVVQTYRSPCCLHKLSFKYDIRFPTITGSGNIQIVLFPLLYGNWSGQTE